MTGRPLTYPLGTLGRLGNQLHQLAATVGVARSMKRPLALPPDWPYRRWFSIPDDWFADDPDAQNAAHIAMRLMRCHKRWRPYMQDFSLWSHAADEVREALRPSVFALAAVGRCKLRPNEVAVHIRRGDYVGYGPDFFPMLDEGYYRRAVESFGGDPVVDCYSDDHSWLAGADLPDHWHVEGYGAPEPPRVEDRSTDPDDWRDLLMMARYRNIVISNSNYSWWSAFLSDGAEVRYPSVWYGKNIDSPWRSLMQPGWVEVAA